MMKGVSMVRDFTDEAKNMIVNAVDDCAGSQVQDSCGVYPYKSELEAAINILEQDCVVNFPEIEAQAENMVAQGAEISNRMRLMILSFESAVKAARRIDHDKSVEIHEAVELTTGSYIDSMRALAESIHVTGLGSDAASVRYNFGRYHGAYEDSIFGSTEGFAARMGTVGGGLYQQFYDSINVTEPYDEHQEQLDNLYAFLQRDPDTVMEWERDAMLAYLDSCVIEDGRGSVTLDYEKISMILTGFYREENYSPWHGFRSYTKYYASDMLTYISEEYNGYYQFRASAFSYLEDPLIEYANLNAVLTATNAYYQELHTDKTYNEEWEILDFGIKVYQEPEESNRIVVSTVEHDNEELIHDWKPFGLMDGKNDNLYNDEKHNIYITNASSGINFSDSVIQQYENGKVTIANAIVNKLTSTVTGKVEGKITSAVKDTGLAGGAAVVLYRQVKQLCGVVQETEKTNDELDAKINFEQNREYCEDLCIGGQTACCGTDGIMVINPKINERELQVRVAYYNIVHDEQITVDEVISGYEAFVAGKEEGTETLEAYSDSRDGKEYNYLIGTDIRVSENEFETAVESYLGGNGAIRDVSAEEIEAAIEKATETLKEGN